MLINLSNHIVEKWSKEQLLAAKQEFGEVVDMQFPNVDPKASYEDIASLADCIVAEIVAKHCDVAVHIMGEMTLTFAIVTRLKQSNIKCVASTTDRIVRELEDGKKEVTFHFVQFREY